jgi:hypothetical protein
MTGFRELRERTFKPNIYSYYYCSSTLNIFCFPVYAPKGQAAPNQNALEDCFTLIVPVSCEILLIMDTYDLFLL